MKRVQKKGAIGFIMLFLTIAVLNDNYVDAKINFLLNEKSVNDLDKKVVVYSADWCTYCPKVKDYLKSKGVNYEEKNIEKNPAWKDEVLNITNQEGIPVTIYKDIIVIGFKQNELDKLISSYNNNNNQKAEEENNNKQDNVIIENKVDNYEDEDIEDSEEIVEEDKKVIEKDTEKDSEEEEETEENIEEDIEENIENSDDSQESLSNIKIYGFEKSPEYVKVKKFLEQNGMVFEEKKLSYSIYILLKLLKIDKIFEFPITTYSNIFANGYDEKELNNIIYLYNKDTNKSVTQGNGGIIVYTCDGGEYTKKALEYLNEKEISIEERNVNKNEEWLDDVVKIAKKPILPVILYENEAIVGFNSFEIDRIIEKKNSKLKVDELKLE